MKIIYSKVLVSLCILLVFPESLTAQGHSDMKPARITWTVSSGPFYNRGFGMNVTVENIDTHFYYSSIDITDRRRSNPFSRQGFIQVPAGRYVVSKVEIPVGLNLYINWSDKLKDYFGIIEVKPGDDYDLGCYKGQFRGPINNRRFVLVYNDASSKDSNSIEPSSDLFVIIRFSKDRIKDSEVRETYFSEELNRWEWITLQKD